MSDEMEDETVVGLVFVGMCLLWLELQVSMYTTYKEKRYLYVGLIGFIIFMALGVIMSWK